MRTYRVQEGDSPASIAARGDLAGCPRCSIELPRVNAHKVAVTRPNGHVTFASLAPGEVINLPDTWFHPARESLPAAYYRILPHPDGRTRGSLGGTGDSPDLDAAVAEVAALAALPDGAFVQAAGGAAGAVDAAIASVAAAHPDAAQRVRAVRDATGWSRSRNRDLAAAVAAGDGAAATRARLDVQSALATALGSAHLALLATKDGGSDLRAAARAAVAALSADPNYCTSVTHPGTPVNAAVHRFKVAWNRAQSPKVPIGTGSYETATVVALAQVAGGAPSACGADRRPVPAPEPPPPRAARAAGRWPAWLSVVAVGAVVAGGAAAWATRRRPVERYA